MCLALKIDDQKFAGFGMYGRHRHLVPHIPRQYNMFNYFKSKLRPQETKKYRLIVAWEAKVCLVFRMTYLLKITVATPCLVSSVRHSYFIELSKSTFCSLLAVASFFLLVTILKTTVQLSQTKGHLVQTSGHDCVIDRRMFYSIRRKG